MDRQMKIYLPSGAVITLLTTDAEALELENYLHRHTDIPRVESRSAPDTAEQFSDAEGQVWEVPTDMLRHTEGGRIMTYDEVADFFGPLTLITDTDLEQNR